MNPHLLILDLDETLIHARELALSYEPDFWVPPYPVYLRPGVHGFLDNVHQQYRLRYGSLLRRARHATQLAL